MSAEDGKAAFDRSDVRVRHDAGVVGAIRGFLDRVRSGDLGALPVVVGLAVIWTVFQVLNPIFLSSNNLVNLLFDCSTVGVISLGIVCILMVGEIDLSVGSVSGFASAVVGVLWVNADWPVVPAILVALLAGGAVGAVYATLFNRLSMPSFVSTLAGLLAVLGLQLYILGETGSINLPYGSPLVTLGQTLVMPHWAAYALVLLSGAAVLLAGIRTAGRRRAAGLTPPSLGGIVARAGVLTVGLLAVAAYLNTDRGVPWMFALFVGLVAAMDYALKRTRWGRSVTAVGGNREAARRAGIGVDGVYLSVFMLCSGFAAHPGLGQLQRCEPICDRRHEPGQLHLANVRLRVGIHRPGAALCDQCQCAEQGLRHHHRGHPERRFGVDVRSGRRRHGEPR